MPRPVTSFTYHARCHMVEHARTCYHQASLAQKILPLNMVVATTGYARKYAIRLLNEAKAMGTSKGCPYMLILRSGSEGVLCSLAFSFLAE